ncbi:transcription initiation factor IIA, gamma subunit [Cystobasidium minutum MCA 4210]|uniref:transcription initiation factor IIA, gamma subunit n=1 Tax=Cystobasidium minutum MCA 4210 TaxID=1397322 RepID=UPI0034CD18BF|eukprot:jgi/Rhomi1/184018/fgenesh1_pm.5_\
MAAAASSSTAATSGNAASNQQQQQQQFYQLYRRSSIGMSLTDALDELIESGHIAPHLARKVVEEFDKAASQTFSTQLKNKCTSKAKLQTYRLCDEVWTFSLRDAMFKLDGGETVGPINKVKIVAQKGTQQ